jgi:hypothetical protein
MLADQVTARQIERVDHMERDDERYPTTVEGSVRLIDSYDGVNPQVRGKPKAGTAPPDRQISSKPARRGETVVSCDLTNRTDDGEYDA